jgi:hypothetical protein
MNKNLNNYIKKYSSVIPDAICKKTILDLQESQWSPHTFYNAVNNEHYSNSAEPEVSYDRISTTSNIMNIVWKQIENYVLRDFNFPWWKSWQGFHTLKYNRYTSNTAMTEHCDHIHDMFDGSRKGIPILTVIGLLNSDFDGGEFVILEDEIIDLTAGDIIVFPSIFLYPHRVNQILDGTRYSFASWVY